MNITTITETIEETRADTMCRMYGEVVTKSAAARILNCAPATIKNMLEDGRLTAACGGERVDMRSIAAYIEAPAAAEENGRKERIKKKYCSNWAVT